MKEASESMWDIKHEGKVLFGSKKPIVALLTDK
jgi:hypothetical protein